MNYIPAILANVFEAQLFHANQNSDRRLELPMSTFKMFALPNSQPVELEDFRRTVPDRVIRVGLSDCEKEVD